MNFISVIFNVKILKFMYFFDIKEKTSKYKSSHYLVYIIYIFINCSHSFYFEYQEFISMVRKRLVSEPLLLYKLLKTQRVIDSYYVRNLN